MQGTIIYDNEGYFELVRSVYKTVENYQGTFTADDVLSALEQVKDDSKINDNLNARRIRATLATLSSHMGDWQVKEVSTGVYQFEG